jgi:hypothetical protein
VCATTAHAMSLHVLNAKLVKVPSSRRLSGLSRWLRNFVWMAQYSPRRVRANRSIPSPARGARTRRSIQTVSSPHAHHGLIFMGAPRRFPHKAQRVGPHTKHVAKNGFLIIALAHLIRDFRLSAAIAARFHRGLCACARDIATARPNMPAATRRDAARSVFRGGPSHTARFLCCCLEGAPNLAANGNRWHSHTTTRERPSFSSPRQRRLGPGWA